MHRVVAWAESCTAGNAERRKSVRRTTKGLRFKLRTLRKLRVNLSYKVTGRLGARRTVETRVRLWVKSGGGSDAPLDALTAGVLGRSGPSTTLGIKLRPCGEAACGLRRLRTLRGLLGSDEVAASVLLPAGLVALAAERLFFAEADGADAVGRDAQGN
jgi:hypothetical protein